MLLFDRKVMFFWVVDEESNKKTGIKGKQFMHKKQHTKSALSLFFPELEVCALNIEYLQCFLGKYFGSPVLAAAALGQHVIKKMKTH